MGRILTNQGGILADNAGSGGSIKLLAGATFQQMDGVQLGVDGKAYPIKTTDYSVVTNCTPGVALTSTATGRIVAETNIGLDINSGSQGSAAFSRQALLQGGRDNSIYVIGPYSSTSGIRLQRYSAIGALIKSVNIDTDANTCTNQSMAFLSNGNIVISWVTGSAGVVRFAVYTPELLQVIYNNNVGAAAAGVLGFGYGWQLSRVVALDGGGFAFTYLAPPDQKLAIFSNAGMLISNASIKTWTGTTNPVYAQIEKLSNGNLVIAARSSYTTAAGFFYGIWTSAGAQILAFTQLEATGTNAAAEISIIAGYFCIARQDTGSVLRATVFDNAGAVQGAAFSGANAVSGFHRVKLLNDGVQFLMLWQTSTGSLVQFTKLPITGSANASTTNVTPSTTTYNSTFDAFYENGFVVGLAQSQSAGTAPTLFSINVATGSLTDASTNTFGTVPITNGTSQRIISGGDFAFVTLYEVFSSSAINLFVGKWANSAIVGSALAATGADTLVSVGHADAYPINQLKGSQSKAFDHTSGANIYGNSGAILNYGLILNGM